MESLMSLILLISWGVAIFAGIKTHKKYNVVEDKKLLSLATLGAFLGTAIVVRLIIGFFIVIMNL